MSESSLKYYERHQTLIEDVIGKSIDEALSTQPENPIVTIAAALLKRCKVESAADATLLRSATSSLGMGAAEQFNVLRHGHSSEPTPDILEGPLRPIEYYERHKTLIEDVIGASIDEALSSQPENPIVTIAAALLKRCKVESAADATLLRSAASSLGMGTEMASVRLNDKGQQLAKLLSLDSQVGKVVRKMAPPPKSTLAGGAPRPSRGVAGVGTGADAPAPSKDERLQWLVEQVRSGSADAAGALADMTDDESRVAIARAGGIVPLVALLTAQDPAAGAEAARALRSLAYNATNKVLIAQDGAIAPLVTLVQSGTDGQKQQAARALKNLADNNAENQVSIAQAGAIAPLVTLVQSGTDDQKEQAAGALFFLADIPENKVLIAQAGAIAPLVPLVKSGTDGQKEHAAAALQNLAFNAENKVLIAQAGAIAPLVTLVKSGTDDQKEYAAAALWNLAYDNVENQVLIAQAGAITPLVTLVQSGTDGQKENATGALQSLFIASPASPVGSQVASSGKGASVALAQRPADANYLHYFAEWDGRDAQGLEGDASASVLELPHGVELRSRGGPLRVDMFRVELIPSDHRLAAGALSEVLHIIAPAAGTAAGTAAGPATDGEVPHPLLLRMPHRASAEQLEQLAFYRAETPDSEMQLVEGGCFWSDGYAEVEVTSFSVWK
eukprot:jgi/Chrpa1/27946/Chrysochromulina_OHIO_Genome00012928-RA